MVNSDASCIGIIAAEVNSIEQRQIMQGIIEEAQQSGLKTVVFSNIYNPYEYDFALDLENRIYELMFSQQLCGLILIAESFINEILREKVREMLSRRQDIPIVIIGIYVPSLDFPNVTFINADDFSDIADITEHLVSVHGFTKIDILTGMRGNDASEQRVCGYRSVLEHHGIAYSEARVHYGSFWMDSGEALAKRYISGELELPEAILCANDYMAYGLLDTFLSGGIRVPEDVTVTGYEFIHERIFHSPMLTTYQRGRRELGAAGVRILCAAVHGDPKPEFHPPAGKIVTGYSCSCGVEPNQLHAELENLRTKQTYEKWNVLGTLEQELTLCGTLDELIEVLGSHQYWVRYVQNMFLCLCENWYDTKAETPSETISCRSIMPWHKDKPPVSCDHFDFTALYQNSPPLAVHYYLPLFFESHFFGYFVLEYHQPDTYDDIFRNWMKSISIGLTFLCMKNDIRYLLQCQNLAEQTDSLTGLYNRRGFESALSARMAGGDAAVYAIALKICTLKSEVLPESQAKNTLLLQKIAEIFRICGFQDCICGRTSTQTFICAGLPYDSIEDCARAGEKILAVMLHNTEICSTVGMESVLIKPALLPAGRSAADCVNDLQSMLEMQTAALAEHKRQPHAEMLYAVRNRIYHMELSNSDAICKQYSFSAGYFRQVYKEAFGISFHQDVIQARVYQAIFLLQTTVRSIASIAEACGYDDCNYFMRQFRNFTGLTPAQYRKQS